MIYRHFKPLLCALTIAGGLATTPLAVADERESLEQLRNTTLSLIDMLVQEGVLSKEKADTLIKQAQAAKQSSPEKTADKSASSSDDADGGNVIHVQYVPEFVKDQLRDEIKQEVMAKAQSEGWAYPGSIPDWLNHIEWTGDLRLRYERVNYPQGNAPLVVFQSSVTRNLNINDSTQDQDLWRVRARLGAKLSINDWLSGGIQLTTGDPTNPVSPNQNLQTSDAKYSIGLDRAYLKIQPSPWAEVSGGRFANPWFHTDLVWYPDLAFDGIAASFKPKFSNGLSAFGTMGAFPLAQIAPSATNKAQDKWLLGAQAGIEQSFNQSTAKFGIALYDYLNVEGKANNLTGNPLIIDSSYNATVPAFRQGGNSTFDINKNGQPSCGLGNGNNDGCGLASKFNELNLTGELDLAQFNPLHVVLTGDYVRNIGFDQSEILARTGNTYPKQIEGYQLKLGVGTAQIAKRNDWKIFGAYKRVEADAVLDAYTDADFHFGGTNAKGWILGASYGLDKNVWLTARWLSADEIVGPPLAIDVLMVDFNAKF